MDWDEKDREIRTQLRKDESQGKEPSVELLEPFVMPEVLNLISHELTSVNNFKVCNLFLVVIYRIR